VHVLACAMHLAELIRQADAASERALKAALSVAKADTR
jgi:tellurite resistance protein